MNSRTRYEGRNCGDHRRDHDPAAGLMPAIFFLSLPPVGESTTAGDEPLARRARRRARLQRPHLVRRHHRPVRLRAAGAPMPAAPTRTPASVRRAHAHDSTAPARRGRRFRRHRLSCRGVPRTEGREGVKQWNERSVDACEAPRLAVAGAILLTFVLALAPGASAAFKPLFTATSAGERRHAELQPAGDERRHRDPRVLRAADLRRQAPDDGRRRSSARRPATPSQPTCAARRCRSTARSASPPRRRRSRPAAAPTVGDAATACAGSERARRRLEPDADRLQPDDPARDRRAEASTRARWPARLALFVCPPPADLPAGTTGRAPLGLKIVQLTLRLTNAFTVPAGHARLAPARRRRTRRASAARTRPPPPRPRRSTPRRRSSRSPRSPAGRTGRRLGPAHASPARASAGSTVRILAGGKQVGSATTSAAGSLRRPAVTLKSSASDADVAKVVVPARYLRRARSPAFAPLPCMTSIVSGLRDERAARVAG